jgi:ABC-type phosphate/phosphonate transport system substrate-binding protein
MTMRLLIKAMIAATVCLAATAANAQSTSTRFGCDGQLIEPTSKASSPKALQLTISSGKVGVDFGAGNIAAKVESNNNIQLKFKTDEFVGEYFNYTGDLFLIYKSGHLARLTCKQS